MKVPFLGVDLRLRVRQVVLLSAAVLLSATSAAYFWRYIAKPISGLVDKYPECVVADGRLLFSPRGLRTPLTDAGLLPGDEIVSMGGAPVRDSLYVLRADARFTGFNRYPLEYRRNGGPVLTLMVTPISALRSPEWALTLLLALALGYAAFAFSLKLADEPFTAPLVLAGLTALVGTCLRPFSCQGLFPGFLAQLGVACPWLLAFFGMSFPFQRGSRRLRPALVCGVSVLIAAFLVARLWLLARWFADGSDAWLVRFKGLEIGVYASDMLGYLAWAGLMVHSYLKVATQTEKRQLRWILTGLLIAVPPYFFFEVLPWTMRDSAMVRMSLGNSAEAFLAIIPVFLIVGLAHNPVVNFRVLVSRYAVYAALFVLLFVFFCLGYLPLRDAIVAALGIPSPVSDFLSAAAAFVLLVPLRTAAVRTLDRVWLGSRIRRSPRFVSELERRNSEYTLALEWIDRERGRTAQSEKLTELRSLLRGITSRVREASRGISHGLSVLGPRVVADGDGEAQRALELAREGSVQIGDLLKELDSHLASRVSVPVLASPSALVRSAMERVRRAYPAIRFSADLQPAVKVSCCPEELVDAFAGVLCNSAEAQEGCGQAIGVTSRVSGDLVEVLIEDRGSGIAGSSMPGSCSGLFSQRNPATRDWASTSRVSSPSETADV